MHTAARLSKRSATQSGLRKMNYVLLWIAIIMEVIGTFFMKRSDGFTNLIPSLITITTYVIAFYLLSLAVRTIPTGIAYAIWSGIGIFLIAVFAWAFQGQRLDNPAILGMALIVAGVVVVSVFSKTAAH